MKKILLTITGLLLLLSGCGNMIDVSDQGMVNVKMAVPGSSRYIAGGGETVTEAVLGFVRQGEVYNVDFIENITDFTGEYLFTGIPVGDYSFLAMLLDSKGDVISMAVQGVTIEAGKNDLVIDMGPGFSVDINALNFNIDDLDAKFTLSLDKNEITLGIPANELDKLIVDIKIITNAKEVSVQDYEGKLIPFPYPLNIFNPADELSFDTLEMKFTPLLLNYLPDNELKFKLILTSWDEAESTNTYFLKFVGI